jgi:enoyl-CoA hydratase/carnithine racemase
MDYEYIIHEKKGHIVYVTMNRPEVMNSLNAQCHVELNDIWNDFRDDDNAWVAILTGAGPRAFSAGNDLKATAEAGRGAPAPAADGPRPAFGGITAAYNCPKPIIAAINGYAVGGGCEIALACDILIASENARFGLPEPRVGLVAGAGGIHRLPQQVGLKVAMGMMLTGKQIDAAEAYRIGLVNEVVPADQLMATAERWANEILECAPVAVRLTKEASMAGLGMSIDDALAQDAANGVGARMSASPDSVEGPRAFAEKRTPNWSGT